MEYTKEYVPDSNILAPVRGLESPRLSTSPGHTRSLDYIIRRFVDHMNDSPEKTIKAYELLVSKLRCSADPDVIAFFATGKPIPGYEYESAIITAIRVVVNDKLPDFTGLTEQDILRIRLLKQ